MSVTLFSNSSPRQYIAWNQSLWSKSTQPQPDVDSLSLDREWNQLLHSLRCSNWIVTKSQRTTICTAVNILREHGILRSAVSSSPMKLKCHRSPSLIANKSSGYRVSWKDSNRPVTTMALMDTLETVPIFPRALDLPKAKTYGCIHWPRWDRISNPG